MNTERQSNIELLRIVCMFMIVLGHFMYHGIMMRSSLFTHQDGILSLLPILIHTLCICAVNTFILISGYFSIRPKAKSFFSLYIIVAFYACVLYTVHLYVINSHVNRWSLYNTIMPFGLWATSNGWWFMPQYFMLFVISPILNKAIDMMSKRELMIAILSLCIVVFYFGWYRAMEWAQGGFNFIQFVFLYFIGRYMALYTFTPKYGLWWTVGWLFVSSAIAYLRICEPFASPLVWSIEYYNSPLCVLSAICLFNACRSIYMKNNRVVNWFAASVLSIYLLHDNGYFREFLYGTIAQIYDTNPTLTAYVQILVISLGVMIGAICVDKIRMMITNPLVQYCVKYYDKLKEIVLCRL